MCCFLLYKYFYYITKSSTRCFSCIPVLPSLSTYAFLPCLYPSHTILGDVCVYYYVPMQLLTVSSLSTTFESCMPVLLCNYVSYDLTNFPVLGTFSFTHDSHHIGWLPFSVLSMRTCTKVKVECFLRVFMLIFLYFYHLLYVLLLLIP